MTYPHEADDSLSSLAFLAFAKRVTKLEGDVCDANDRIRALERRLDHIDTPPAKRSPAPPATDPAEPALVVAK